MDSLYDVLSCLRPVILNVVDESQGLCIETPLDDGFKGVAIPPIGSIIEIQNGAIKYRVTEVVYQQGIVTVRITKA